MPADSTVFVVDDDPELRKSLRWLLESNHLNVETFASAEEFLDGFEPTKPGCVLLDIRMPGMSGIELQEHMAAEGIGIPVIIITGYGEVSSVVRAMKCGACDILEKPFQSRTLLQSIQQAIERDRQIREARARRKAAAERIAKLTNRERQVMHLVVAGKSNKQIAAALKLRPKTIEHHRAKVMDKLAVTSVAKLVQLVLRVGVGGES